MTGAGHTIIAAGATGSINGFNNKGLNRNFDNAGTTTYSGNDLYFGLGAPIAGTINNLASGIFSVNDDADFTQSSSAAHSFNNTGTFNKNGAGTTTDFNVVPFNNSGTVNINAGTLSLNAGGSHSSTNWNVPAGSVLNLGGNFSYSAASILSGAGAINFLNGTHNIIGQFLPSGTVSCSGATVTIANTMPAVAFSISAGTVNFNAPQSLTSLTLVGGALAGNGDVTISSTLNWSGGTMTGAGHPIFPAGATGSINGFNNKGLNRNFYNSGTVTYTGNNLYFGLNAALPGIINNLVGGVFNVNDDADFTQSSAAAHAFNNTGTFNKNGAGTTTDFNSIPFYNSGTLNLNAGNISFNSGGANYSTITV